MKSVINSHAISLKVFLRRVAESRQASILLLIVIFWIVAAAGFSGFYNKWTLREDSPRFRVFGIEQMLNASAHKPFVYRQLVPMLTSLAYQITPDEVHDLVVKTAHEKFNFIPSINPELRFHYIVVYCISFLSLFSSLFVLREIALDAGAGKVAAVFAPMSFALTFPYLQTVGGFFYDMTELFFLSLAFLMASRFRVLLLFALVLPATLNKETFIFFIPTLYPLLRPHCSMRKSLIVISGAVFAAGIVNTLMKLAFIDAPGAVAKFHLWHNLEACINPWFYIRMENTYGMIGPGGMFIGTLAVVLIILFRGWSPCPPVIKRHLLIASVINLPLCILFAYPGELRNLSFLFIGLVILIAFAFEQSSSIHDK
ncbi:MAG: hypothetical protein AB2L11_04055 [Syntrophobacteraceae bacterium]